MPKLKTKKAIKKRMRFTKTGKIKRFKAGRRHLMAGKSGNKKRQLRKAGYVAKNQMKMITQLLSPGR
jgi:large subunit ribosomal protein L35